LVLAKRLIRPHVGVITGTIWLAGD
jgi:hypothetical protein